MAYTARTVIRNSGEVGGDRFWEYRPDSHNKVMVERGAKLDPKGIKRGSQMFGGDFGYFEPITGMFTLLQAWKVIEVTGTTSFKLYKDEFTHNLKALGDVILAIAPSLATGTKTAATVTGVQFTAANIKDGGTYYEITGTIEGITVGNVIVMADATDASANVLVPKVNAIMSDGYYCEDVITDDYVANKGEEEVRFSLYYKISLLQIAKVIPPYVLQLNSYINNTHVFNL